MAKKVMPKSSTMKPRITGLVSTKRRPSPRAFNDIAPRLDPATERGLISANALSMANHEIASIP